MAAAGEKGFCDALPLAAAGRSRAAGAGGCSARCRFAEPALEPGSPLSRRTACTRHDWSAPLLLCKRGGDAWRATLPRSKAPIGVGYVPLQTRRSHFEEAREQPCTATPWRHACEP